MVYDSERYFFRCIYKTFRLIQCSVWFYFLPFIALMGSYMVPYFMKMTDNANPTMVEAVN